MSTMERCSCNVSEGKDTLNLLSSQQFVALEGFACICGITSTQPVSTCLEVSTIYRSQF